MNIEWARVFDEVYPEPGATEDSLREWVERIRQPLDAREIAAIHASQRNPFSVRDPLYAAYRPFDPSAWRVPPHPLPDAYLSFLRWSNGGEFRTGERWFQFFAVQELRDVLLGSYVPRYMPLALPFATNGGPVLYVFDMRNPPRGGEYPILIASSGDLDYACTKVIAGSFVEACSGVEDPGRLL